MKRISYYMFSVVVLCMCSIAVFSNYVEAKKHTKRIVLNIGTTKRMHIKADKVDVLKGKTKISVKNTGDELIVKSKKYGTSTIIVTNKKNKTKYKIFNTKYNIDGKKCRLVNQNYTSVVALSNNKKYIYIFVRAYMNKKLGRIYVYDRYKKR